MSNKNLNINIAQITKVLAPLSVLVYLVSLKIF